MKIFKTLLVAATLSIVGCASQDYSLYTKAQTEIEVARHNADAAKYKAMGEIANSGDASAKVAAVIALALGQNGTAQAQSIQAPRESGALQWASVLVPGLTNLYSIAANTRVSMAQSDNSARVAMSTNESFVGIAGKIQAPVANVTTTTTLSGTGTMGAGSYTTTDSHATTTNPALVVPQTTTNNTTTAGSSKVCTFNTVTSVMSCI